VVGVASQGAADLIAGRMSHWENYAGSAFGGAVAGEASLYLGPLATGAVFGAATNLATQGLKMATGSQCHFKFASLAVDTTLGAAFGRLIGPKIAGITAGRGSYSSIFEQMVTKSGNGMIDNVSVSTAFKMVAAKQAEGLTGTVFGPIATAVENVVMDE
jgi:type VI secretion system secreted protein VgrG